MDDDNIRMIPIGDLHFEKRADTLPADLIDRITLIHHAFRDYLKSTLDETIDNFKYDQNPESEIRIWEHMASVFLALKYEQKWPDEKLTSAIKVLLGLSMGAIQNNDLDETSTKQIASLWNTRNPR